METAGMDEDGDDHRERERRALPAPSAEQLQQTLYRIKAEHKNDYCWVLGAGESLCGAEKGGIAIGLGQSSAVGPKSLVIGSSVRDPRDATSGIARGSILMTKDFRLTQD
jgi:hypothetical protein